MSSRLKNNKTRYVTVQQWVNITLRYSSTLRTV